MFGLNWPELMIISVVALIVIGPEDLPKMFRELGRFTAKLRQMSREFSRAMEQAAKETGVSDVAKDLRTATSAKSLGLDAVKGSLDKFEKWDPLKNAAKPTVTMPARSLVPPPMPATPPTVSSLTSVAERDAATATPELAEDLPGIEDELADDLAEIADLEALDGAPPENHGPNTQALYDKAALRKKVLEEQTAKLKAIEAGTYAPEAPEPTPPKAFKAPSTKPKAAPEAPEPTPPKATKPRSTKPKAEAATQAPASAPQAAEKPKRSRAKADPQAEKPAKAKTEATPKTPKKTRKTGEETA